MPIEERIAEYRRRATEAREKSESMTSAAAREGLLKLAKGWDEMAERILKDVSRTK
jgi:hypothetical protein